MLNRLIKGPLSIVCTIVLNIIFVNCICARDTHKQVFDKCFSQKYDFICEDKHEFLRKMGINIEEDLVDFNDLKLMKDKTYGACKGGIYVDKHDNSKVYFLKQANSFHEIFCSRLMNHIMGTKATPIVKIVKNKKRTTASLKLPNFTMTLKADLTNKRIKGEVLLAVAMDFLGLIDRHSRNNGYVTLNDNTVLAARVDFDACFDYESTVTGTHQGIAKKRDHMDLKHLYVTMQTYPKDQVEDAIKQIVKIPDEKIVMIAFQTWAILSESKSPRSFKTCMKLAKKLIERKKAFKSVLKKSRKNNHDQSAVMFH